MKLINYNNKRCLYFEGQHVSTTTYDPNAKSVDGYTIVDAHHHKDCSYMKWNIIVKQHIFENAIEKELGLLGIETNEYLLYTGANLKYANNNRIEIEYDDANFENITKMFERKEKIKNILKI